MIKCFIGKTHKDALHTYNHMRLSSISPNSFTFTFLLRCFESFEYLQDGLGVHGHVVKLGFDSSVFVLNTLLDFYAKCGQTLGFACRVFEEMPEKDVVTWNTMISAYMVIGEIDSAIKLFESMPERNIVTWNSVIGGLSKCGTMELASSVFERMPERNEVSWNSMVSGYVKVGDVGSAVSMFNAMPVKTIVSCTTVISGYMMTGDVELARKVFEHMPAKNVVSWNAMIAGYVHNHMFDQALSLFHHMLIDGKCRPDQTTLVSVVSACAHLGSLEHGNLSSSVGRWQDAMSFRKVMKNQGIEKVPGCSSIQIADGVHEFTAKDMRHVERKEIYRVLNILDGQVKLECDACCEKFRCT
ncbi:hypothetical protein RJ639_000482 [Escallonia herrerae]|uniref:Chlororespiratory reduction 2 n=1 Tax=Escallonia herrerae TaxID=1293975 RepID=A0AA89BJX4_9ASTE|nr:hypothetical protein RJ639_000482 [Escallonia herrerae]